MSDDSRLMHHAINMVVTIKYRVTSFIFNLSVNSSSKNHRLCLTDFGRYEGISDIFTVQTNRHLNGNGFYTKSHTQKDWQVAKSCQVDPIEFSFSSIHRIYVMCAN